MRAYPNCTARNSPKENLTEHSIANCSAHAFPLLLFYCQPLIMAKSHHGVHTNPLAGLELTSSHPHSRKKHQCPLVPAAQMLTSTSSSLCALPSFYSFWLKKKLKKNPIHNPMVFRFGKSKTLRWASVGREDSKSVLWHFRSGGWRVLKAPSAAGWTRCKLCKVSMRKLKAWKEQQLQSKGKKKTHTQG